MCPLFRSVLREERCDPTMRGDFVRCDGLLRVDNGCNFYGTGAFRSLLFELSEVFRERDRNSTPEQRQKGIDYLGAREIYCWIFKLYAVI